MSGRRIDDHTSFAGKSGRYPLPEGNKMKAYHSSEGAGAVSDYPDTSESIQKEQGSSDKKIRSQKMKPGYRY